MKKNYGCILAALILLTACGQKKEDSVTTVRPVKTARVESRSEIRKDFSGIVEAVRSSPQHHTEFLFYCFHSVELSVNLW